MTLIDPAFCANVLLGLTAGATVSAARLGLQLFPADRSGLVFRESLSLPLYATAATLYVHETGLPPTLAPLLAMGFALIGYSRLERLARRYILRK